MLVKKWGTHSIGKVVEVLLILIRTVLKIFFHAFHVFFK
jgi:hypothetical protein